MPISGPTVVRRQLGRRLRSLREAAGVTVEQVEAARFGSRAKLWRIESGQVRVSVPDVWALCRIYQASESDTVALARLAERTAEQGWWHTYRDVVPDWFRLYLDLESVAARICIWEDSVVPGELQIADYARALWRGAWPDLDAEGVEPHVALRLERQQALLTRTPAPHVVAVLGENVLRREVGGPGVMAEQLEHLTKIAVGVNADVRVLPFTAGAHPAVTGAFRILGFDDPEDPDVVYLESEMEAQYLERAHQMVRYRHIFTMLCEHAVPIGDFAP